MSDETETGGQAQAVSGEIVSTLMEPSRTIGKNGNTLFPVRTREQAVALSEKRWGRYRRAAAAGAVVGVLGANAPITEATRIQAYIELVAVQAKIANDVDNYNAPAAFRNVRAAIGADVGAPSRQAGIGVPAGGALLVISPELIAAALARLRGDE